MGSGDPADVTTPPHRDGIETRRLRGALKERLFDRPQVPVRVGRFVVVDLIGEGGMGMVWRAYDPELDRRVAVKLLRRAIDDGDERATARLVREAKAMAQLNHPNVVTVHEVGVHDGQVFVAMEYVDAGTLATWCGEHPRGTIARTRALVRLFEQAARGLAAAHAAGVEHRDVKPANMLIDRAGRLRIADFGLAGRDLGVPQWQADADGVSTERSTDAASVAGTPAYMAPEQLDGIADAKSDQFGLCVSFFEACFGILPFAGTSATARCAEILAGRIRGPAPGHRVPGWLRAVIVRGLQADPAARWSSVDALADALSRGDRSRNQKFVAAAVGLGAVGAAWSLAPGVDPCVDADSRFAGVWNDERREEIQRAFAAVPAGFAADTAARVGIELDAYAEAWRAGWRDACLAARVEHRESEALMAERMRCLDDRRRRFDALVTVFAQPDVTIVQHADRSVAALPLVASCAEASYVAAEVAPPEDPDAAAEAEAIATELSRVSALGAAGKYADAVAPAQAVVVRADRLDYGPLRLRALTELARAHHALGDSAPAFDAALRGFALAEQSDERGSVENLDALGVVIEAQGEHTEALAYFERALAITVRRAGADHPDAAEIRVHLGILLAALGKYARAHEELDAALATIVRARGADRPEVATIHGYFADMLDAEGRHDEALAEARTAYDIVVRALGPDHPEVASMANRIGRTLERQGRYDEALAQHELALAIQTRAFGTEHPDVIVTHAQRGIAYENRGDFEAARREAELALAIALRLYGPDHPTVASSHLNLAVDLQALGHPDLALEHEERALWIWERTLGPDHPDVGLVHNNMGGDLEQLGRLDEALEHHRRALSIFVRALGPEHAEVGRSHASLGFVALALGDFDEALDHHRRALAINRASYGDGHHEVGLDHDAIGFDLSALGDHEAAETEHRAALAIFAGEGAADHADALWSHLGIATTAAARGRWQEAAAELEASLAIGRASLASDHPNLAWVYAGLAICDLQLGRKADAIAMREQLYAVTTARRVRPEPAVLLALVDASIAGDRVALAAARTRARALGMWGFMKLTE